MTQISERKSLCRGRYLEICRMAQLNLGLNINLCKCRVKPQRTRQEQLRREKNVRAVRRTEPM